MDLSFSSTSKEDNVDIADSTVEVHDARNDGVVIDKSESSDDSSALMVVISLIEVIVVSSIKPVIVEESISVLEDLSS